MEASTWASAVEGGPYRDVSSSHHTLRGNALLLQLAFGASVNSVPGMAENALRTKLHGLPASSPTVTLVDFPGISKLRP